MPEADKTAGQSLIDDLTSENDPYALTLMIVEAARIADRLAKLDRLLVGDLDTWVSLRLRRGSDDVCEVYVDNALAEARQQATALRHLIAEIQRQHGQSRTVPTDDDDLAGL